MKQKNILIISDNISLLVESLLIRTDLKQNIKKARTLADARNFLKINIFDVIITELTLTDCKGVEILTNIITLSFQSPIIVLLEENEKDMELNSLRYGADDFLHIGSLSVNLLEKSIDYALERSLFKKKVSAEKMNLYRIIESSKDAIIVIDGSNRIVFFNNKTEAILNKKNLLNETAYFPFSEDENIEYEFINDKEVIFVDISAVKIEWEDKPAVMINLRDISKRKNIEHKMAENSVILKTIFDAVQTGLALVNYDTGVISDINPKLEDMLGVQKRELIGKQYRDHIGIFKKFIDHQMIEKQNRINKFETFMLNGNGIEFPVIMITVLLNINENNFLLINIMDISDQKTYESLLENNLKYEKFISKITTMFYENEEIENIFTRIIEEAGIITKSEHIGITSLEKNDNKYGILEWWNEGVEKEKIEFNNDAIRQELSISDPLIIDYDIHLKEKYCMNKNIKISSSIFFPIFFDNRLYGYLSIDYFNMKNMPGILEIDFLKTLTQIISMGLTRIFTMDKIKDNFSLLNLMIHTIPEPIFYKDKNGKYLGCNDIFANRIMGIPEENLIGKSIIELKHDLKGLPEDMIEKMHNKDIDLINSGKSLVEEVTMMNVDGIMRNFISYRTAFKNTNGEPAGLVVVMIDISEKNRKEAEKDEMNKRLIESEKLSEIGQLSAGIAHEFNNILSIIKSSVQLMGMKNRLKEFILPVEVIKEFKSIEDNVKKASDIVADLMQLSKPVEIKRNYHSITAIIDEVLKVQKKQFEIENISIERDYHDVPELIVDRGQMYQVFLNLSINARHSMKKKGEGKIKIAVKAVNKHLEIFFMDTGTGINDDIKEKIFQPFFSTKGAHSKDGSDIKGTGLGLSVTRNIVIGHNGSIDVESEAGKGAVFIIRLPINSVPNSEKSIIIEEKERNIERVFYDSIHIAIVEDEPELAESTAKILKLYGYLNIQIYNNGKDLLDEFNKNKFDLVIMDFFMPGLNGNEILENLQETDSKVKAVFITGNPEELKRITTDDNIIEIITKPFDNVELVRTIDRISLTFSHGERI